jgi:phosphohistidine phosphatase SixA
MWRACNPLADFAAIRGLQPNDPPDEVKARLSGETRDVMLVGHMPSLPRIVHALAGGREEDSAGPFPQHGLVALEANGDRWVEGWRLV